MKILHVLPGMDPKMGGVVSAVRTLITSLSELGIKNEVACLDASNASWLNEYSFTIHALGPGKGPWLYHPNLISWFVANICHYDVVIAHGLWQYHTHAIRKAFTIFKRFQSMGKFSEELSPRFYVMPHGMLDPYFQRAKGRKFKAMRNWLFWKLIEGKVVNDAGGLLFTCEEECRLAREPFRPYQPKRELVVGLGVEEPPPYTVSMRDAFLIKCPDAQNKPYILFLGRIHEKKGVDLLINAYAQLQNKLTIPSTEVPMAGGSNNRLEVTNRAQVCLPNLVIAGPGLDSSYGIKIQQQVDENNALRNSVFFPGMLTGDAKWGAYYESEAFVLISHQENFGVAVVEALACGKPVLISNQINIWKEIEFSDGGMITSNSVEGAFQVLERWVWLNDNERKYMSQKALYTFKNFFSVKPVAKSLLEALSC